MTIKEYISVHANNSFIKQNPVIIKPFSLFGKSWREEQEQLLVIYQKQKEIKAGLKDELWFYNLEALAKKVDFSLEIKKVEVDYDSLYSDCPDVKTTFFIDDEAYLKISKKL